MLVSFCEWNCNVLSLSIVPLHSVRKSTASYLTHMYAPNWRSTLHLYDSTLRLNCITRNVMLHSYILIVLLSYYIAAGCVICREHNVSNLQIFKNHVSRTSFLFTWLPLAMYKFAVSYFTSCYVIVFSPAEGKKHSSLMHDTPGPDCAHLVVM